MESTAPDSLSQPDSLWRSLQRRAGDFVMLPAVAREAVEIVQHPDCTADQFVSVVERDVKLATDMLALANSALFACRTRAINLKQAVVRLGFRKCRNLILGSSAASLMQSLPLQEEWVREVLAQHNHTTATTCVHLNRAFNLGYSGEEFTAALFHDVGRLLLAIASPTAFAEADALDFQESVELLEHEAAMLGTDHCQFGARFAQHYGLPNELVAVIRYHHRPELEQQFQELTSLVAAADHVANHLQVDHDSSTYEAAGNVGIEILSELRGENLTRRFVDIAPALIEEILEDVLPASESGTATIV